MTAEEKILSFVKEKIRQQFSGEATGHDYFHIERVVTTAKRIAKEENVDLFFVELAAWLHDVGDHKLNGGVDKSEEQITAILKQTNLPSETITKMIDIVSQVSFSKGKVAETAVAKIVQDADRLDAMGAIGLARVFAFGGSRHQEIYNPEKPANTSIQHFFDKLLTLKEKMNTDTGREIAEKRHRYLETFLDQFYKEWNSKD